MRSEVQLSNYSTMQIGGRVQYFSEPKSHDELLSDIHYFKEHGIPFKILGKGSNVVFNDSDMSGGIVLMTQLDSSNYEINPEQNTIRVPAGMHLHKFSKICQKEGLKGAEFLSSIPGTVGGAVMMNAGYSRNAGVIHETKDIVKQIGCLDKEMKEVVLDRTDISFGYRHSGLRGHLILWADFQLEEGVPDEIGSEIEANFNYRNEKQDLKHPSSGSIFKNPSSEMSAGRLIDECGLKGFQIGGAKVSDKHGNYIINAGNATFEDVECLIRKIQETVKSEENIELETEVELIKEI